MVIIATIFEFFSVAWLTMNVDVKLKMYRTQLNFFFGKFMLG